MSPDEYLDRLFTDSFKREVDQDEAVWRTLPFFATALGLAGALVGYVASHLPNLSTAPLSLMLHVLIALALASLVAAGFWIWVAVRPREYVYLPRETSVLEHTRMLRVYYETNPPSTGSVEDSVTVALRSLMIDWLAEVTTTNRAHNARKQTARTFAFIALFIATALAGSAAFIMFVEDRLGSIHLESADHGSRAPAEAGRQAEFGKARTTASSIRD